MQTRSVELNQFNGFLAYRKEFIMTRHPKKVVIECVFQQTGLGPFEATEIARFPINVEVIVFKQYQDDNRVEFSVEQIQNGKTIHIAYDSEYVDDLYDVPDDLSDDDCADDREFFFDRFERLIESFEKKGFQ